MNIVNRHLSAAAVMVTCVIASDVPAFAQAAPASTGSAGSAPVTIVNPLPVPVTGTLSVAPGSTVKVNNPADNPVLVRDVGVRAQEPYYASLFGRFTADHAVIISQTLITVPSGKRLVIEDASGRAFMPKGQLIDVELTVIPADLGARPAFQRPLTVTFQHAVGLPAGLPVVNDILVMGEPVRIYAEAGDRIYFGSARSSELGSGDVNVSIAGYFVDVP